MSDTRDSLTVGRGVEIGVEDAAVLRPLQLGARPLADLEPGCPEAGAELACGEADQDPAGHMLDRRRPQPGSGLLRHARRAGGEEEDRYEGYWTAHRRFMAARPVGGKLAPNRAGS